MAAGDALAVPQKGLAFRLYFEWRKNDGTLLSGAAGVVSQISKDGGTFANTTNTPTELATASGVYYIDFTATETGGSISALVFKGTSTSAGAVPVVQPVYLALDLSIPVNATRIGGSVSAASTQQQLYDNNIITGNVDTGTYAASTTDFYADLNNLSANQATDYFKGRSICFTGTSVGMLAGQAVRILGYAFVTPFGHFTTTPMTAAPINNATFAIV